MKKYFIYGIFPALILLCCIIFVLSVFKLPNYANYTGIRPIETKIQLIQDFEHKNGKIDAVVFGSSIVDYGFSAELFSKLMSEYHGKQYNVFNFATGGAEPRTLPVLYKVMRESVKSLPKDIYIIMPAEKKLDEENHKNSPDYTLNKAPVSTYSNNAEVFKLQYYFQNLDIIKNLPGVRDLLIYGNYNNLDKNLGTELYYLNDFGDRINYTFTVDYSRLKYTKELLEEHIKLNDKSTTKDFFANTDIKAIQELVKLVKNDGGKIILIPHAASCTLWNGNLNNEYIEARKDFYSKYPDIHNFNMIDDFLMKIDLPNHYVADEIHLNTYGSIYYTQLLFYNIIGKTTEISENIYDIPDLNLIAKDKITFNNFSALIKKAQNDKNNILKFKIVDSYSVPALPKDNLFVALRTPDNKDKIIPMINIKNREYYIKIDLPISNKEQFFIFRVLYGNETKRALNAPVAQYVWTTEDNLEKDY